MHSHGPCLRRSTPSSAASSPATAPPLLPSLSTRTLSTSCSREHHRLLPSRHDTAVPHPFASSSIASSSANPGLLHSRSPISTSCRLPRRGQQTQASSGSRRSSITFSSISPHSLHRCTPSAATSPPLLPSVSTRTPSTSCSSVHGVHLTLLPSRHDTAVPHPFASSSIASSSANPGLLHSRSPISTSCRLPRRGQRTQARKETSQEEPDEAVVPQEVLEWLGIAHMEYRELQKRLKDRGLRARGKEEVLRQRLAKAQLEDEQRERQQLQTTTVHTAEQGNTVVVAREAWVRAESAKAAWENEHPASRRSPEEWRAFEVLDAAVEKAYQRFKDRENVAQQQQQQQAHKLGINSDEWVKRLHSSHLDPQLIRLPASAQELQLFLEQSLPEPLPCSCEVLDEIPQNVLMQRGFGMQAGFGRFARHVAYVMTKRFPPGAQEIAVSAYYQAVFDEGLECINSSFSLPLIEDLYYDRNCADSSTATQPLKRPDYCLWSGFALLVKGEDKPAGHRILEPAKELSDKAEGGPWNKLVFGGLPFLICYAAAGARIQFYMMHRDTNLVEPISRTLDMHTMQDRAVLLSILLHLVALLARVVAVLPESPRLALAREIKHQGSTITTFESYIKKNVKLEFAANTNKSLETLQQVYIAVAEVDGVVHAKEPPTLREDGSYKVLLEPLAYDQSPRSEDELRSAIKTVLQALTELHGQGFVHRDIRWSNILFTGQGWLLTDLEGADRADQVPEVSFRCWGNHTLQDGKYTRASDMELVGKLLNIMPRMSENAQDLQQKLTCHDPQQRLSAQEALAHPWFS